MDNKYDVFISYSRHDIDVVNAFVDRLEREGFSVWIDRDGIKSGDAFKKIILQAIKNSAVVLFFSSQFSNQSGWTAKEIGVAVKYKKPVIPILLDGSNFNEEVEFDLINLDFIDYQDVTVRGVMMDRLVKSLKTKITNPIGQKKAEEARLKAEVAERERLEQERRKKEEAERKAREEAERQAREAVERERKALQATTVSPTPHSDTPNPQKKKTLWIVLAAAAAVALLLLLLLKPKKEEPIVVDPDTETYQACQTVADYRAYMRDYGHNALHYADAKTYVEQYMADSSTKAQKLAAQLQAQQSSLGGNGTANGYEDVDLALPSGTLWATCNIGADKPEDYGDYYVWGETKTKTFYNWDTYKYANGDWNKLTKYSYISKYGNNDCTDNLNTLQADDDPATANWGEGWYTPSKSQWDELLNNTTNTWTTRNGVKGRLFTSEKNGQTLFLPAAGYRWVGELDDNGSYGYYWSRSLFTDYPYYAWFLRFNSDFCYVNNYYRDNGFTVRPVRQK